MIEEIIKETTIRYFKESEIGQNLEKALNGIEKAQETVAAYCNDDSPEGLKILKIGTTAIIGILYKVFNGKNIKEFTTEDWKEIASVVVDRAIIDDGQQYSVIVFDVYAKYVDFSVKILKASGVSVEKCDDISRLSKKVKKLGDDLEKGKIKEVDYTEQCLWLLLESMIKLLASSSKIVIGEERANYVQNVAMLTFEYGRYSLYKQEQEILTQYLEHQGEVDAELEERFSVFRDELLKRCEEFEELIKDAFDPDMPKRLKASTQIARNAGVAESEILDSVEKVDEFFM
ncbi:hypothetical protein [Butyrivibrio hungatei]|uniref:Uncharacterized protein n=1 Tax=Butyrivibrio hungatei TaxID=185008 RepID=A0A1D9NYS9_9FIRM|nr:hypothetical protein [Butyrivibrio hungatei]AOZ95351.1 hypothetical protein bhn_I0317 [Butyrivibrio hungatei]